MSDKDLPGIVPMADDVTFYPADETHLRSYRDASDALLRFQVPRLVGADNPLTRLLRGGRLQRSKPIQACVPDLAPIRFLSRPSRKVPLS